MNQTKHSKRSKKRSEPIEVEVTAIPRDDAEETGQLKMPSNRPGGLYVGIALPWIALRAYVGRDPRIGLTLGFKIDWTPLGQPPSAVLDPSADRSTADR